MKKIIIIFTGFILGVMMIHSTAISNFDKDRNTPIKRYLYEHLQSAKMLIRDSLNLTKQEPQFLVNETVRGYIQEVNIEEQSIILLHKDVYENNVSYKTKMFFDTETRFYEFYFQDGRIVGQVKNSFLQKIKKGDAVSVRYHRPSENEIRLTRISLNLSL